MKKFNDYLEKINNNFSGTKPTTLILGTTGTIVATYTLFNLLTNFKELKFKLFRSVTQVSFVKNIIQKSNESSLEKVLSKAEDCGDEKIYKLPEKGTSAEDLEKRLLKLSNFEKKSTSTSHSGTIYMTEEHTELLALAYKYFIHGNPLHTFTFPAIRKFEAEIISMAKYLLGGDEKSCGLVTGGGTESILMALKAYRDYARATRNIKNPNVVVPRSAHAAFEKGCHYFGIELISVDIDPKTFTVNPKDVEKLINSRTIAIVGSAPNYPVGTIDPIVELGQLAKKYNIGLHVDCCLGGFFLPFAKINSDNRVPEFDFNVEGVTTISADTHKYGLATKGSSVCLFKTNELRKYTYFVSPKWMGGIYGSPSIAGSRPGALLATCWTALVHFGKEGYVKITNDIIKTINEVKEGVKEIPELEILGDPKAMILAFGMKDKKNANIIYGIGDSLNSDYHWELNQIMDPPGIHLCFTSRHIGKGKELVEALKGSVKKVLDPENKGKYKSTANIYGQVMSIPDGSPVSDFITKYFDAVQKVDMSDKN